MVNDGVDLKAKILWGSRKPRTSSARMHGSPAGKPHAIVATPIEHSLLAYCYTDFVSVGPKEVAWL